VGRRGVISLFKLFLPAFATCRGRGRGVGTLWSRPPWFSLKTTCTFKDDVTVIILLDISFMFVVGLDEEEDRRERKTSQKV
jgi:hypothetical protein